MRPLFPPSSEINESLFQPQAPETKPPTKQLNETPEAFLEQALSSWPVIQDHLKNEINLEDYEHIIAPIRTIAQPPNKLKLIVQDKLAHATLVDSFLEIIIITPAHLLLTFRKSPNENTQCQGVCM